MSASKDLKTIRHLGWRSLKAWLTNRDSHEKHGPMPPFTDEQIRSFGESQPSPELIEAHRLMATMRRPT